MATMQYSVLMSVYAKEQPEYLRASMESIFLQSVPTDDFVLICDGPLTPPLDALIAEMQKKHSCLHVYRLAENKGLGNALKEGIPHCKNELIARMDSDDISRVDRCERQLAEFASDSQLDILSGTIEEFIDSPMTITGRRVLPASHEEICHYSKKRSPFNHPAVMYKKSSVLNAGGYTGEYRLEDYALWVRMLMNGCHAKNIDEPLLYMRVTSDLYLRRGGKAYAKEMLRFHRWMRKVKWISWWDYFTGAIPHALICVLPNIVREKTYRLLRKM